MSLEAHPHPKALSPLWLLIATQALLSPGPSAADVWCHLWEKKISQGGKSLSQRYVSHKSVLVFCPYWACFPPASVSRQSGRALLPHTTLRITVVLATRTEICHLRISHHQFTI